jgi:inner membrane protein
MLFYTHLLFGILLFLLVKGYLAGNVFLLLFLVLLGSILPDIDEHKSKIARWSGLLGKTVSFLFRHRGILHAVIFPSALCIVLGLLWSKSYALALLIGYVGHLFADALTPMGIPILYPFTEFRLRGPLRTGSIWEWVMVGLLIILILKILL